MIQCFAGFAWNAQCEKLNAGYSFYRFSPRWTLTFVKSKYLTVTRIEHWYKKKRKKFFISRQIQERPGTVFVECLMGVYVRMDGCQVKESLTSEMKLSLVLITSLCATTNKMGTCWSIMEVILYFFSVNR